MPPCLSIAKGLWFAKIFLGIDSSAYAHSITGFIRNCGLLGVNDGISDAQVLSNGFVIYLYVGGSDQEPET